LTRELRKCVPSKTDILGLQDLGVQRLGGVNRNANLVVNAAPNEFLASFVVLRRVKNVTIAVDDLDLLSDMDSSQRVVTSDHDNTMTRLVEGAYSLDSVRLQGALEDEETGKVQVRLDLFTLEVVDAVLAPLSFFR
jgi:hypothetical protein